MNKNSNIMANFKWGRILGSQGLALGTALLILGTFGSRVLGFVKEILTANIFGVSYITDAYLVALFLPVGLVGSLANAVLVCLVPIFVESRLKKGEEQFLKDFLNLLLLISIIAAVITFLVFLLSKEIIAILGQGFDLKTKSLATYLLRIMAPSIILVLVSTLFMAFLYSYKNYLLPAISGLLYNLGLILGLTFFVKIFGLSGLGMGAVLAGLFYFTLPAYAFFLKFGTLGGQIKKMDFTEPLFKNFTSLFFPFLLVYLIPQLNIAVDRIIASGLKVGSVSALNFAYRLIEMPISLFGFTLATALLPVFSEKYFMSNSNKDPTELEKIVNSALKFLFFIILPISAFLIVLREEIIRIIFVRGAFDENAANMTENALAFYSLGLFAYCGNVLSLRLFIAQKDIKTPLKLSIWVFLLNLILSVSLARVLGPQGLALATSLSAIFRFILFAYFLSHTLGKRFLKPSFVTLTKSSCASLFTGAFLAASIKSNYFSFSHIHRLAITVPFGLFTYFAQAKILKMEEPIRIKEGIKLWWSKLSRLKVS